MQVSTQHTDKLAEETLDQMYSFMFAHNKAPAFYSLIRYFNTLPHTAEKCRIALSFLPTGSGVFDGGNFKISVCRSHLPHFHVAELPSINGPSSSSVKILVVSETARDALLAYSKKLAAKESRQESSEHPLISRTAERSCWESCTLF